MSLIASELIASELIANELISSELKANDHAPCKTMTTLGLQMLFSNFPEISELNFNLKVSLLFLLFTNVQYSLSKIVNVRKLNFLSTFLEL